jgi:hypothetical protein
VGAQPVPGLAAEIGAIPLRDRELEPAEQDAVGVAAVEDDRFVRRQQRDTECLEILLQLQTIVGVACAAGDVRADHDREAAVGPGSFAEKILQAAITRHGHVEHLVRVAQPAFVQRQSARLDVPEVGGDGELARLLLYDLAKLTRDRKCGVLEFVGGRAADEGCWHEVDVEIVRRLRDTDDGNAHAAGRSLSAPTVCRRRYSHSRTSLSADACRISHVPCACSVTMIL